MDFPAFTLPSPMVTLFIGLLAVLVSSFMIEKSTNLWIRLLGMVLLLGGVSFMLSVTSDDVIPPWLGVLILIIVFIAASLRLARSDRKANGGTVLVGWIFVILGILAFLVQLSAYVFLPTGAVGDLLESGWNAILQIFGLAGTRLE